MFRTRYALKGMLIVLLFAMATGCVQEAGKLSLGSAQQDVSSIDAGIQGATQTQALQVAALPVSDGLRVALSADQATISYDERVSREVKFELPLLHLRREREAAPATERTLSIEIAGLPAGVEVQLEAVSRHADVATGEQHRTAVRFSSPDRPCSAAEPCQVRWTFDAGVTPSDLYRLQVKNDEGELLWSNPNPERPDFAMLDIWDVTLDDYTVRITYATLFPFAQGPDDDNKLSSAEVTDFIANQFVPIVVDTWHTQVHAWGFGEPFHPDWDADGVVEVIFTAPPFALFDGTGTYSVFATKDHPYPERRIWWTLHKDYFQRYDSSENSSKVTFAHEFFHLMQWNVLLHTGQSTNYRVSIIEAQGQVASTVQYPELALGAAHVVVEHSDYTSIANRFHTQQLNTSYTDLEEDRRNKYDAAPYWRFLYEQYNGMSVFRAALEEMAHHFDSDVVRSMDRAMDAALARVEGPFGSFEESLVAFARANYALRLENGRCVAQDFSVCAGNYYDPDGMYGDPMLDAWINYKGGTWAYDGVVPVSYGMDLLEVSLDGHLQSQPVTVTFQSKGAVARLHVQIWELGAGDSPRAKPLALSAHPQTILVNQADAPAQAVVHLDRTRCDHLGFIITRLDADESVAQAGDYRITLQSAARGIDDQDPVTTTDTVTGPMGTTQ